MLKWTQEYSTGIEELDAQHKTLFEFVNLLEQEIKAGNDEFAARKAFEFMTDYTKEHFEFEEMCMHKTHCSEAGDNERAHKGFMNKLKDFETKLKSEGPKRDLLIAIHQTTEDWIKSHILKIDSHLKSCIKRSYPVDGPK